VYARAATLVTARQSFLVRVDIGIVVDLITEAILGNLFVRLLVQVFTQTLTFRAKQFNASLLGRIQDAFAKKARIEQSGFDRAQGLSTSQ
jgi:hypothetical protein